MKPSLGRAAVIRADARTLPLPNASVDLIVTSPPYWGQRDYEDGGRSLAGQIGNEDTPAEYIANLIACTAEWARVLKLSGSIFVNLGDKYDSSSKGSASSSSLLHAGPEKLISKRGKRRPIIGRRKSLLLLPERYRVACVDQLGLTARAVMIWTKLCGMPESVGDRVGRTHEDWVHLTVQPNYFADIDPIREPHSAPQRTAGATAFGSRNASHVRTASGAYEGPSPKGKVPGSVWAIAPQPFRPPDHLGTEHYAPMPTEWARRIVSAWSPPSGLVVDPFGGTGTTALAARALGRDALSFDLSHDYARLADWRTNDPGELARVLGKPKPPKQVTGQIGFDFEEAS